MRKVLAVLTSRKGASLTGAVLGTHSRMFRDVFLRANSDLMDVFGMQLVELPKADRVTVRQKRGAQGRQCSTTLLTQRSRRRNRFAEQELGHVGAADYLARTVSTPRHSRAFAATR